MFNLSILSLTSSLAFSPPACQSDTDCATGQLCVLDVCREQNSAPSCSVDTDCPDEQVCNQGACQAPVPAPPAPAPQAGCTRDDQCKGDRICTDGRCTAPSGGTPPGPAPAPAPVPAPVTEPAGPAAPPPSDGWALAGGIVGLSLMVPTLGLGIASEATRDEQIPAIPLGAGATVLIAAATPIAAAAGGSARRRAGVRGSLGLRVTSWIAYGVSLTNAVVLIGLGASEVEPWPGAITTTTVLGVASGSMMAADALISHRQAREKMRAYQAPTARFGLSASPLLPGTDGRGGTFGISGRF